MLSRREALAGAAVSAMVVQIGGAAAQHAAEPLVLRASPIKKKLKADAAQEADLWAFNGEVPGPILRLRKGETRVIRLVNDLQVPTSLHIHGLRHDNSMDGVAGLTQTPVLPGQSFEYRITPRDSGVFLYMPYVPGKASEPVERGLHGLLIVDEADPQPVDHDIGLVLDDWRLQPDSALEPSFRSAADLGRLGRLGNMLTVNGKPTPDAFSVRPGSRVRLRIAGAMTARVLGMRFDNMVKATVIAIDGQPCEAFDPLKRLVVVAPGSRYEVILDCPAEAGKTVTIGVQLGDGMPVLNLVTAGEPLPAKPPVRDLPPNPELPLGIRLQDARRAELTIAGGVSAQEATAEAAALATRFPDPSAIFTLNHGFPSGIGGKPLFSVRKGQIAVVAITNRTAWPQVITTHGHVFRVLHALDDGWEPFFLDTVVVPENRTVRIALLADLPGKWLIRSANLDHADAGVLTWFEVNP
jgi:FtsP/CotA-like multicopper oxidase with cupredoxin domain